MAFGQRRLTASLFVVALGVAELAARVPWRTALPALAVLTWLNVSLLIQFGTGMIPRQSGVPVSGGGIHPAHVGAGPSPPPTPAANFPREPHV